LLMAPLIVGSRNGAPGADLLSHSEYNRLARMLREHSFQPSDLLGPKLDEVLVILSSSFVPSRVRELLERGFLLSQAVERWTTRSIWVVTRADAHYPRRLKSRLKEDAPPILYGCGELSLLETGGLAVVGSRDVTEDLLAYTERIGNLASRARHTLISGGAKGIDRAAMTGALQNDGIVVGVLADSLERGALARDNRGPLIDKRLVMISPYDPSAGFNAGHAMQRNKVIYALSDAALVVASDFEKGGTWAGAIEQLEKYRSVPVFIRNGSSVGKGNAALLQRGGIKWPEPSDPATLAEVVSKAPEFVIPEAKQESLALFLRETKSLPSSILVPEESVVASGKLSPSSVTECGQSQLWTIAKAIILECLKEFRSESDLAKKLNITKPQAKAWLAKLIEEGAIEKKSKPVRYRAKSAESNLL
jgi:DNA processing protein